MNIFTSKKGILAILIIFAGTLSYLSNDGSAQGKTYKIGARGPGGGWVFYDRGHRSEGWRYLEAAPRDQGTAWWGRHSMLIPGARGTEVGTGKDNTRAIMEIIKDDKTAAKLCTSYRGGGKNDWFLPSRDELNLMYTNLKKRGIGRFYHSPGKRDGGYKDTFYWSSSDSGDKHASAQSLCKGEIMDWGKGAIMRVRAIRAF